MSSFDEFARSQFPLRPDHPDFKRLGEVVTIVESLKQNRVVAREVYDRWVDVYSATYVAANRAWMSLPTSIPDELRTQVVELMTNAWMEGLFFGVQFQTLGGHQPGTDDLTAFRRQQEPPDGSADTNG